MELSAEKMIAANEAEYPGDYHRMSFITEAGIRESEKLRESLLADVSGKGRVDCQGTKLYTGELSPGCQTCRQGSWSCLFINGICNGRCFYCPTTQKSKEEPMTNNLRFARPRDYLDYVALFGFAGVSISGGEPFMTFDRTLTYVRKVKQRFGDGLHLWLYTNGILATPEKLGQLAEAGLDEIRFDISADSYNLDKVRLARGRIPTVTVEIPAIPEDYQRLRDLLPALGQAGVHHLNLHQLRCTPFNLPKLLERGYVFSHGPKVIVPDSELTALRLLLDSVSARGGPAVNYCSYAYKYRYQRRAARLRCARLVAAGHEDVTEAGFVRSLWLKGSETRLEDCLARLREAGVPEHLFCRGRSGKLSFSGSLWPLLDFTGLTIQVSYFHPRLRDTVSYGGSYRKVPLNRKRNLIAERLHEVKNREIDNGDLCLFQELFLDHQGGGRTEGGGAAASLADIYEYERLPQGLQTYF